MPRARVWLLLAAALTIGLLASGCTSTHKHAPSAQPTAAAAVMPDANAKHLQAALNSSKRAAQAAALISSERAAYQKQNKPMLPPGTTVAIDPKTFVVSGNVAIVKAKTSAGESFILHLYRENGQWLIVYTEAK